MRDRLEAWLKVPLATCRSAKNSPSNPYRAISSLYLRRGCRIPYGSVRTAYKANSRWSIEARNLLRAILRECTYLPDPFARKYFTEYAIRRFRVTSEKAQENRKEPDFERYLRDQQDKARHLIKHLRRANEGEFNPLLRVLQFAYGRLGRRRHELMKPLLRTQTWDETLTQLVEDLRAQNHLSPSNDAGGKEADDTKNVDEDEPRERAEMPNTAKEMNRFIAQSVLTPALAALVKSQIASKIPQYSKSGVLRDAVPQIDEHNTWGRVMPVSRIKNQTRDWYGITLERVFPPLPTPEWFRLRDLASGATCPQVLIRRRKSPLPKHPSLLEIVLSGAPLTKRTFGNSRASNITPHSMRNMWEKVFTECPLMEWQSDQEQWHVTWGHEALFSWKERYKEHIAESPVEQPANKEATDKSIERLVVPQTSS